MASNVFTIYGLAEPHTGIVRYVGKTAGDPHIRYSHHAAGGFPGTREWVKSLPAAPFLLVLEEGTDERIPRLSGHGYTSKSHFAETKWIKRFRRTVINKGLRDNSPLVWDYLTNPTERGVK